MVLRTETRILGDLAVLHCRGRLVIGERLLGSDIRLACSRHVTDLLRRTRLDEVFTVYTSEQDAIASFPGTEIPSAKPVLNISP